jgi:outer membrane protein
MRNILLIILFTNNIFGLNLNELIQHGMNNSVYVKIAKEEPRYQKHLKDVATAKYYPSVQAGLDWQYLQETSSFLYSPTYNYYLDLQYSLFDGWKSRANVASKQANADAAQADYSTYMQKYRLELIKAYILCLKAIKRIEVEKENVHALKHQYNDTSNRFRQGMIAKNELLLIETAKYRAIESLTYAKSDLRVMRKRLESISGMHIDSNEIIEDIDTTVTKLPKIESAMKHMMSHRSELQALHFETESLANQVEGINSAYYPHIDLSTTYKHYEEERRISGELMQPQNQLFVTVGLSWDLYSGGEDDAKKSALLQKISQQHYKAKKLKIEMSQELFEAYEKFTLKKQSILTAQKEQHSAQEHFRIYSEMFRNGKVDALTLLISQSEWSASKNKLNNARYELFLAYQNYLRIIQKEK